MAHYQPHLVNEHRKLWSALLTGGAEATMRNEFLRLSRQIAATRVHINDWPPTDISTILVVSSTVELVWPRRPWLDYEASCIIRGLENFHLELTASVGGKSSASRHSAFVSVDTTTM